MDLLLCEDLNLLIEELQKLDIQTAFLLKIFLRTLNLN